MVIVHNKLDDGFELARPRQLKFSNLGKGGPSIGRDGPFCSGIGDL